MIEMLLQEGADVNEGNGLHVILRHYMQLPNKTEAIRLLVTKGADINKKSKRGWTPLANAAQSPDNNCRPSAITLLLEIGARIEETDNDGLTPLMIAAAMDNDISVKLLLEKGAKLDHKDGSGKTVWEYAAIDELMLGILNKDKNALLLAYDTNRNRLKAPESNEAQQAIRRKMLRSFKTQDSITNEALIEKIKCELCTNAGTKKCSVCQKARYCSKECQKADWPFHKTRCIKKEI